MSTKTLEKKYKQLSRQVMSLKTLIITASLGHDPEGQYRPAFVKQVLKAEKKSGRLYDYKGSGSFLEHLKGFKRLKK